MRFGDLLREARAAKGLTQAELGNGVYSARFISLIERGQRQPTPAMVEHFASRLGMDTQTLNWWVEAPPSEDPPALALAMFAAYQAKDLRDSELAAAEAEHAAAIAYEQRSAATWWMMAMLQAESLIELRRLGEAEAVLLAMDASSLLPPTPELRALTSMRLSAIARNAGRLRDALDRARAAVTATSELPEQAPTRLQAAFVLIAALSVKGDLDQAWEVATSLEITEGAHAIPSLVIARAAWVVGNVAFRRGDLEVGREQHDLAARLLLPQTHLEIWTDFHKASACNKLYAGITDDSVRESLGNAELGLKLVSTDRQRMELALAQARLAVLTEDLPTAEELLDTLAVRREVLNFESLTELEECLGRFHAASGSMELAGRHLTEAARLYTEAGADEKALEMADRLRTLEDCA